MEGSLSDRTRLERRMDGSIFFSMSSIVVLLFCSVCCQCYCSTVCIGWLVNVFDVFWKSIGLLSSTVASSAAVNRRLR